MEYGGWEDEEGTIIVAKAKGGKTMASLFVGLQPAMGLIPWKIWITSK